jgi:hypothetical protein
MSRNAKTQKVKMYHIVRRIIVKISGYVQKQAFVSGK